MNNLEPSRLAYAAGLFDGEGHILEYPIGFKNHKPSKEIRIQRESIRIELLNLRKDAS